MVVLVRSGIVMQSPSPLIIAEDVNPILPRSVGHVGAPHGLHGTSPCPPSKVKSRGTWHEQESFRAISKTGVCRQHIRLGCFELKIVGSIENMKDMKLVVVTPHAPHVATHEVRLGLRQVAEAVRPPPTSSSRDLEILRS